MSLIERLKLGSELKLTVSIGKLFQRFMTRSAKELHLTELLQKYLKILYGWPLVEQDRNVKKSSRSTPGVGKLLGVEGRMSPQGTCCGPDR